MLTQPQNKDIKKTVRFSEEVIIQIEKKAKAKGLKFSDYIRFLVYKDLESK